MNRQYNNHGRDQFNIENFYFTPSPTGQEFLNRGVQLLGQRDYKNAINALNDAIKVDPSLSDAHYYLAIALLSGKQPKKIDEWTARDIEDNLSVGASKSQDPSKCYALWGIVKHGFYAMNGLLERSPKSGELFRMGSSIKAEEAREILGHLNDPSNPYWQARNRAFGG